MSEPVVSENGNQGSATAAAPDENTSTPTAGIKKQWMSLRTAKLIAAIAGFLGAIMFLAAPFLPVNQTTSTLTWPQNQSVKSVEAPLIAHSPESIEVEVPFAAIRAMKGQENGIVVGTLPGQSMQATQRGLFVRVSKNTVDVLSRDTPLLSLKRQEVINTKNGSIHVTIDKNGVRAHVTGLADKHEFTSDDSHLRPITMGIFSDLPLDTAGPAVQNMRITAHIDTRFTTSPTLIKLLVMLLGIISMLISWVALAQIDRIVTPLTKKNGAAKNPHDTAALPAGTKNPWKTFTPLDAVVYAVLLVWHFIGANTSDDGYILSMVRVANQGAGYTANYYRWYGVSESPFGSPYYDLLQLFAKVSTASIWMRIPALLCAIVTWLLISKAIIPRLGAGLHLRKITTWTAGGVFLMFHMALNNGIRPEPFVAMMALLTWALLERTISTHRMLPATIAVLMAALALSGNPTGLMAVAALVVSLRPILHIMSERRPHTGIAAQLGPIGASGFAVLVAVFGDQTIASVLEATSVRGAIGPNLPWYRETLRYFWLTIQTVDGSMSRRFAVFTMILCLAIVTVVMLRNKEIRGAAVGPSWRVLGMTYGTLILMMFSPTKWTHHFGAYASIAPILAALAALAVGNTALHSRRNRWLVIGAVSMVTAMSLTTVNDWWFVSQFHIPWYDKVPQIHGFKLYTVFLILAVIAFLIAGWQHLAQSFKEVTPPSSHRSRERLRILSAGPITILAWLVVVFYLVSFGKAAVSQYPAYSLAKGNLGVFTTNECGLADDVLVEPDPNKGMLKPLPNQEWEKKPVDGNVRARGPLAGPGTYNFEAYGVPDEVKADEIFVQQGTAGTSFEPEVPPTKLSGQQAGTEGGTTAKPGVNGSFTKLPYGLNPEITPVLGSYQVGPQHTAVLKTAWYGLPKASESSPLIVFTAAGRIRYKNVTGIEHYGQPVMLEYGIAQPDGSVKVLGQAMPSDVGPIPAWRNMRIPRSDIPPEANAVRLVAEDTNLDPDHWVAVTPPRIPHLVTLQEYVGSQDPALIDWEVAFQFPCQRPYSHYAGVAEMPRWRITPDRASLLNNTNTWQATKFGGPLGITEGLTSSDAVATYMKDDWARDWGNLERLTPLRTRQNVDPVPARIEHGTELHSGLWTPGRMNIG